MSFKQRIKKQSERLFKPNKKIYFIAEKVNQLSFCSYFKSVFTYLDLIIRILYNNFIKTHEQLVPRHDLIPNV